MAASSYIPRLALFILLLCSAAAVRNPSITAKMAREAASPVSKEEIMSLIDPLEKTAVLQQCSSTKSADEHAITNLAPYAAVGSLTDSSALSGYRCHASCDGKPFNATGEESDCWGKFRWFCKSNATCGSVVGVKCDGHYTFYHDEEAGKAFASCEGLQKIFKIRTSTCSATGITYRKFMGAGCLGTSYSKMVDAPSARAAAAATAADMRAEASDITAAPLTSNRAGVLLGDQHGQLLKALHSIASQRVDRNSSGHGSVYEGKCEGLGGEVKGVKKLSAATTSSAEQYATVDELEVAMEATLAKMGLPSPLSATPADLDDIVASDSHATPSPATVPPGSLFAALLPAAKAKIALGNNRHLSCQLTCNGREPWLKGALPCWGKLELSCEGVKDGDNVGIHASEPAGQGGISAEITEEEAQVRAKVKQQAVLAHQAAAALAIGAALPLSCTAYVAMHNRKAIAIAEAFLSGEYVVSGTIDCWLLVAPQQGALASGLQLPTAHTRASFEFDASCTGFWTGWFGRRCFGLTSTHGIFESEEKDVELWGLCTGKHGIAGKKGKEGYAMGSWCKGHSAKGIVVESHARPGADVAMTDLAPVLEHQQ